MTQPLRNQGAGLAWLLRRFALLLLAAATGSAGSAHAGGAGTTLPPFPLPVRQTELRIGEQVPMVCVNDPGITCIAPYLDAPSNSMNTDGGTFRSTTCPGTPKPGACRPDYISGAEITGEFLVDWPITRTPPDPDPGIDPGLSCGGGTYKFCYEGNLRLNVTAPGVTVSNPLVELDYPGQCECVFDLADEQTYAGFSIDDYWVPRNRGATCDLALEYTSLLPRDEIRMIGQQAFPSLLCQADGMGACTLEVEPVLVEPDGALTKGCGDLPSNTFAIRFALANEPLEFEKKALAEVPVALGDVNGDGFVDFQHNDRTQIQINDGSNGFAPQSTGLSPGGSGDLDDWTGDGDVDLVASGVGGVTVYPGDGAGGFDALSAIVIDATAGAPKLLDLNGDMRPDVVSNSSGSTRIIWNQSGGPISPAIDTIGFSTTTVGDVDGSGSSDPVSLFSGQYAANSGPGSFPAQSTAIVPIGAEDVASLVGSELAEAIGCSLPGSTCCIPNEDFEPGCDDSICEAAVCAVDSNCCSSAWDSTCSGTATTLAACTSCFDPLVPDCCGGVACSVASCEDVVCALDSGCCGGSWDTECASTAQGWCLECQDYNVSCSVSRNDVAVADVEGDGDGDLVFAITIFQSLQGVNTGERASMSYLTWLPNRQVEDPIGSGGQPLFDPVLDPWRPIGPSVSDIDDRTSGPIEAIDLDGDSDLDLVGLSYWYRNDGGTFSGPFALEGPPPDLDTSASIANVTLLVRDMDGDGSPDVLTYDSIYVPEPSLMLLLVAGAGALGLLTRRSSRPDSA